MKHTILIPLFCVGLAGCSGLDMDNLLPRPPHLQNQPRATMTPNTPPAPPMNATTIDDFDTASDEDKMAAAATAPVDTGSIGTTVASLGDPAAPGFWMETPLVSSDTQGRVKSKVTGRTVKVTLRPISSGGSRISLSALQLLDLDLSGLHELVVYGS
ncbi:D-galactarate dehydratase [uncultured Aliiroseovarius sp.]|uniref:D-galactarate dehydratase n=1 Tax=uncultured Aliiroseovarius sp. TaxID=1658783 RepID=UPI002634A294|nr:D-galactarate dehydratase [uncultured Aliiroseovarius sp.]